MRRIAGRLVLLVSAAAVPAATAQNPPPRRQGTAPAAAPAPARAGGGAAEKKMAARVPDPVAMDRLLEAWAGNNGKLKTLVVSFKRTDTSPAWESVEEYEGNAYLQSPNLACLHFEKLVDPKAKPDPKAQPAAKAPHERIVCTGQEVRQYDFRTKQIFVFPLDKNQRNRSLQEGPLPFLFNLNVKEAKMRWEMTLIDENQDDYLIGIIPREQVDRDVFSKAFLQLSKKNFLPSRMLLIDTNGKDRQDYHFTAVQANQPVQPEFFQALNLKGWKVVVNPGPEQAAPSGPQPAARPPVGQRPAGRPAR